MGIETLVSGEIDPIDMNNVKSKNFSWIIDRNNYDATILIRRGPFKAPVDNSATSENTKEDNFNVSEEDIVIIKAQLNKAIEVYCKDVVKLEDNNPPELKRVLCDYTKVKDWLDLAVIQSRGLDFNGYISALCHYLFGFIPSGHWSGVVNRKFALASSLLIIICAKFGKSLKETEKIYPLEIFNERIFNTDCIEHIEYLVYYLAKEARTSDNTDPFYRMICSFPKLNYVETFSTEPLIEYRASEHKYTMAKLMDERTDDDPFKLSDTQKPFYDKYAAYADLKLNRVMDRFALWDDSDINYRMNHFTESYDEQLTMRRAKLRGIVLSDFRRIEKYNTNYMMGDAGWRRRQNR